MATPEDFSRRAAEMVRRQIAGRGIRSRRLLAAMAAVPRHRFVPKEYAAAAYEDRPLPIGHGQTISQPYMVAYMLDALELRGDERVLEIGTGSGYQTALLGRLAGEVVSVERIPELAVAAQQRLEGWKPAEPLVYLADGARGVPQRAPYQAIVVAAAARAVPPPLLAQLDVGGRLVMPVGEPFFQTLVRVRRTADGRFSQESLGGCVFVPLVSPVVR